MAALGIDQHRIDAERVDLPFPPQPQVSGTAHAVQRVTALEHHALDTQLARGLALAGERLPVVAGHARRQAQARIADATDQRLELCPTLVLAAAAPVFALPLQQVVGQQRRRQLVQQLLAQGLAADALLQQGERLDAKCLFVAVGWRLPDHQLAIEHGAVGQRGGELRKLGKALGDQLLPPRPQPGTPIAFHQLGADTVPLPFHQPLLGRAEHRVEALERLLQRVRQEERVGLAAALGMFLGRLLGDQRQVALGRRLVRKVGVADHALRHALGVDPGQRGQGAGHQQLRDTDAKTTGEQLEADHQALPVEPRPQRLQTRRQFLGG